MANRPRAAFQKIQDTRDKNDAVFNGVVVMCTHMLIQTQTIRADNKIKLRASDEEFLQILSLLITI